MNNTLSIGESVTALVSPGFEIIGKITRIEGANVTIRDVYGDLRESLISLCERCDIRIFWSERDMAAKRLARSEDWSAENEWSEMQHAEVA